MAPRQTNFGGGEVDPLLWGRTDLPLFGKGLRTCLNWFISRSGAAHTRPGTTFVAEAKFPDPADPMAFTELGYGKARLVPFVAADQAYVLEVSYQCIRFYALGASVQMGPAAYEVTQYETTAGVMATLPYTWQHLPRLRYAQIGDSILFAHPGFPLIELRRNGHTDWSAREVDLSRPVPAYHDVENPASVTTGFAFVSATAGHHSADYLGDTDHQPREWLWLITALVQDPETGEKYETVGELVSESWDGTSFDATVAPLTSDITAVFSDMPITLRRAETAGLLTPPPFRVLGYNVYRGRGELFGFLGTTTSREFVDVGDEPNYQKQPPRGTNPFLVQDEVGATSRIENPATVTHFQQRRWLGGTWDSNAIGRRIETLFASATEDFFDYDPALVLDVAGESLEITLATAVREEIRHLVSDKALLIGTQFGWHMLHGGQGQPVDFDHIEVESLDKTGTSLVTPAEVEKSVLYVVAQGVGVRGLVRKGEGLQYEPVDLSIGAGHLFRGAEKSIVDWAYAAKPWGVLWAAREDGVLLSLTFEADAMVAWARHETDGAVEAVCAIPEGDEHGVYLLVRRTIGGSEQRYIERMTSRHDRGGAVVAAGDVLETPPDNICVDSALQYVGDAAQVFTGLEHLEGKSVYVVAEGHPVIGPLVVTGGEVDAGAELEALTETEVGSRLVAYIGLGFVCDVELLDIAGAEARLRQKQVTHVGFEVNQTKGLLTGQDFDHLRAVPSRAVTDEFNAPALRTTVVLTPVLGKSDLSARACLRQSLPLPSTLVGITRKVVGGDE